MDKEIELQKHKEEGRKAQTEGKRYEQIDIRRKDKGRDREQEGDNVIKKYTQ
jgi:hypothetical protein